MSLFASGSINQGHEQFNEELCTSQRVSSGLADPPRSYIAFQIIMTASFNNSQFCCLFTPLNFIYKRIKLETIVMQNLARGGVNKLNDGQCEK